MGDLLEEDLFDPAPDIHALFVHYNDLYFNGQLGACSVEWSSKRMTMCGGVCEFQPGGGCRIKLSAPLLQLRPSRNLKETLLHEMIHARLMLQYGARSDDDRGGHGTRFKALMQAINASTVPDHQRPVGGYNITVTHDWLAEVDHFRTHHWQCTRCGLLVKRSMNRRPQPADCMGRMGRGDACRDPQCRYHTHLRTCGPDTFAKVKEPEGFGQKNKGAKGGGSSAAVPTKRRRQGKPEGRPITDFLTRPPPAPSEGQGAGPGSSISDGACGGGGALPALAAVTQAAQQHQKQQHPTEQQREQQRGGGRGTAGSPAQPPVEERRRLAAEAAARRMQGGVQLQQLHPGPPPQQPQQPPPPQPPSGSYAAAGPAAAGSSQLPQAQRQGESRSWGGSGSGSAGPSSARGSGEPEVVDLLSSSDDEWVSPGGVQYRGQQEQPLGSGGSDGGQPEGAGVCPVCGKAWPSTASNAEMNAHLDDCLTRAALQEEQP